jgi:hypothetical protein
MIDYLQANWASLALLAAILVLFLALRNRATRLTTLNEVMGQGTPIIVEVFSNT